MSQIIQKEARTKLNDSIRTYQGQPVGTVAANGMTASEEEKLNYNECFIRDFFPSGLAFIIQGERAIARNFLEVVLGLQWDLESNTEGEGLFPQVRKAMERNNPTAEEGIRPSSGLMPASFKIIKGREIVADFGQRAIGRVTPVDSGLWWIFLLRTYEQACDRARVPQEKIAHRDEFQRGIKLILELCLQKRFDTNPTMLVPEGSFTIDRPMRVYGHPLEIQALFYIALRSARELLKPKDVEELDIEYRLTKLTKYIRKNYWLDSFFLRRIYHYRTEEFGENAVNKFNIYPDTVPDWVLHWLNRKGGYLVGNVGVGWIDFRFFTQGNLLAIISSLVQREQSTKIIDLIEDRRLALIGEMPVKICYPALEGRDWELITGRDPKNIPWSYHNGGNWPFLLWSLAAASQKTRRTNIAIEGIEVAEKYLHEDGWPEYYEGEDGKIIGRQSRLYQTWSIAGYLVAKYLLENRDNLQLIDFDEDS